MRLSEAIKEGAKKRPQARDGYYKPCSGSQLGSCALGAAYEGAFGGMAPGGFTLTTKTRDEWPFMRARKLDCPACTDWGKDYIDNMMVHLNDDHHWTRERIADWVATVEPKEGQL